MMPVVLYVKWQRVILEELVLKQPRLVMFDPTDKGIGIHPIVKPLLTHVSKSHAATTPDPTQRKITIACQQSAKGQAQG